MTQFFKPVLANFSAGPAQLPAEVVEKITSTLELNRKGSLISPLELGHRTDLFREWIAVCSAQIKKLYGVGDDFEVLFLQGGARTQFGQIPLNFRGQPSTYLVTGHWSRIAYEEALELGTAECGWASASEPPRLTPTPTDLKWAKGSAYTFVCSNETIHGLQFPASFFEGYPKKDLVVDASSDIFSRPHDFSKTELMFACAQKNAGIAGLTVVILKRGFLKKMDAKGLPYIFDYQRHVDQKSLYNTTPVFSVYVLKEVLNWLASEFNSLEGVQSFAEEKASLLYQVLDESHGFYENLVEVQHRSKMNIVFTLKSNQLEKDFLDQASQLGFIGLQGHRFLGGVRVSNYNAITKEQVLKLIEFMKRFQKQNQ